MVQLSPRLEANARFTELFLGLRRIVMQIPDFKISTEILQKGVQASGGSLGRCRASNAGYTGT